MTSLTLVLCTAVLAPAQLGDADRAIALPIEISVGDAKSLLSNDTVYWLDCREQREWNAGHIDGAHLHPKSQFPDELTKLADKHDKRIIVYCRSGVRSRAVTNLLRVKGFKQAQSMTGGFLQWQKEVGGGPSS